MPNSDVYPRPEYPRPDFQRGTIEGKDWLNLNGPWQFRFDPDKNGLEKGWHLPDELEWREQIIVPFCWESLAAWGEAETASNENYYSTRVFRNPLEVTRANHTYAARYEVGWYRRRVQIPSGELWKGKRIILKIGAADFYTDCWCNGVHVGRHEGGYTPFEFDITDTLKPLETGGAEAFLIFRVEDPMDNHEQPVGKQWHWYTSTSGIWQTVYIEPRDTEYIDCFRVYPDIDKETATFDVDCVNASEKAQIQFYIIPPDGEVKVLTAAVQNNTAHLTVPLPAPYLWNPNQPNLYKVALKLMRDGKALDYVQSYFGMRKIDAGKAEDPKAPAVLRLNNVPRYLRGALYQSYHADGVYTAGTAEALKNDIKAAKEFGFNFLRVHIKIDDPLVLYYADTVGIMLMADMPNFGEGGNTPLGRKRFEEMMRAAIKRDFNHPSIISWCVFNETWGFGGQAEFVKLFPELKQKLFHKAKRAQAATATAQPAQPTPEQGTRAKRATLEAHAWIQKTWEEAKKLDPTRLVEDMSVVHWEHMDYFAHGDTDINSWHFYIDDYYRAKEHIQKVVEACYTGSTFNFVPGFADKGQPLINSEYGGVGALDGNRECSWTFKFLTNELRRHGQISAYIYTELHDVEWEYNGFLKYDRSPKEFGYDPRVVNESNALPIDFPPISQHAPGAEVKIPIASSHYASIAQHKVSLRWRLGGMDSWGHIQQNIATGTVPIQFPHRKVAPAHTIELKLPEKPMLCSLHAEALDPNGIVLASNYTQLFVSNGPLPRREESNRSLLLRTSPADFVASEWSGASSTAETAKHDRYCFGTGHGFFEWTFPLGKNDLLKARRLRVLCEASSRRVDTPQTSKDHFPTTLHIRLNDVLICDQVIVNHPHDSRGALSYLRPYGRGAYGYLISVAVEGQALAQVAEKAAEDSLRLRCSVPGDELAVAGLTLYDEDAGRYPLPLLVIAEW